MQRLGIDIGSKTLKLVLLDEQGRVVFSSYQKHRSKIDECLRDAIHAIVWRLGDRTVRITVTGSSGLRVSELFGIPFVQEVVALKRAVLEDYPEADAILEMGGEDTKLIYLTGTPEQRMNNICAGGTGSFIETMGGLMGARTSTISRLAMGYSTIYPIASRCAVFAKSDVRPLLNAGARKEDIAASVLDAVCTQAVAGLSAGRPITGKVILLGGPFQHISALRDAFCRVTGFDRAHAVVPKDAHLYVARGAATSRRASEPMGIAQFEEMIKTANFENENGITRLRPLFESEGEIAAFRERHRQKRVPRSMLINAGESLFLGVDAGSTTAKVALIDADGAVVAYDCLKHRGDVVGSVSRMMKTIFTQLYAPYSEKHVIRRSCVVGYGEKLCQAAFGIDKGEVETVAHLRAALAIDPQVDFLMDIGGQDIKCFYVHDGVIQDVVLNEACSSGCGSLFDSVVRNLGRGRSDVVGEAMRAKAPVDLGTRCTTFMNSRIRHAQKEGVPADDIIAGVCYATVRNALFKVVRQPDFSKVGNHIVVQGGAFANDALLRAFELETGVEVSRPDLSQIMGAWGAALLARDEWLACKRDYPDLAENMQSELIDPDTLESMDVKKKVVRCDICSNRCEMRITRFAARKDGLYGQESGTGTVYDNERVLVTGNRCERGALAYGGKAEKHLPPPNILKMKRALIASYDKAVICQNADGDCAAAQEVSVVFGIPKSLVLYESYPFWKTLLDRLNIATIAGAEPSSEVFRLGMSSIPSEGMCYPAKLVYGQAANLATRGAEALFMPIIGTAFARFGLAGAKTPEELATCPLVENLAPMVEGDSEGSLFEGVRIVSPDLRSVKTIDDMCEPIVRALAECGIERSADQVGRALNDARDEYRKFKARLAAGARKALAGIDAGKYPGIVLVGHGYHAVEGISHGIDELLGELGYAVLERVDYPEAEDCAYDACTENESHAQSVFGSGPFWYENADALHRIDQCEGRRNLQPIIVRSFGCGIDALAADEERVRLNSAGDIYTELKIDQIMDLATVRIRLRSLAYAHRQREGALEMFPLTAPEEAYKPRGIQATPPTTLDETKRQTRKATAATRDSVDSAPPKRRRRWIVVPEEPDSREKHTGPVQIDMPGPSDTRVRFEVPHIEGVPAPGSPAKGIGPTASQIEEAAAFSVPSGEVFNHSYQGLAYVEGVPKPSDLATPGTRS